MIPAEPFFAFASRNSTGLLLAFALRRCGRGFSGRYNLLDSGEQDCRGYLLENPETIVVRVKGFTQHIRVFNPALTCWATEAFGHNHTEVRGFKPLHILDDPVVGYLQADVLPHLIVRCYLPLGEELPNICFDEIKLHPSSSFR